LNPSARASGRRPNFRRQHPCGPYVLDFYCANARLAIKVDGLVHDTDRQAARDAERDAWLAARGITVMRIPAKEVFDHPDEVAQSIYDTTLARSCSPAFGGAVGEAD